MVRAQTWWGQWSGEETVILRHSFEAEVTELMSRFCGTKNDKKSQGKILSIVTELRHYWLCGKEKLIFCAFPWSQLVWIYGTWRNGVWEQGPGVQRARVQLGVRVAVTESNTCVVESLRRDQSDTGVFTQREWYAWVDWLKEAFNNVWELLLSTVAPESMFLSLGNLVSFVLVD